VSPEISVAVPEGVALTPEQAQELGQCALSFRHFLKHWRFINLETGQITVLGEHLWDGQLQVVEAMENVPKFYNLKARKLGVTTLACAFDGWRLRFGPANGRVHLFSRREDAAKELLEQVYYGLKNLPEWMRLPAKATAYQVKFNVGPDDERTLKSYPASEETAVEASCIHGHVDEWARMKNPEAVWQAIEPSMAGTCHLITTGRGPENFTARFWRRSDAGETEFVPIFVSALNRPDRDADWLKRKKAGMTEQAFRQEFPMDAEDAMFAGGSLVFQGRDVEAAGLGQGPTPPEDGHRYIKAWDIGRHRDAAVGVVLDTTVEPMQVVEYVRLRGVPYPSLQGTIERLHKRYPGTTFIEQNGPGEAVYENVNIPEGEKQLFKTTQQSKWRIIEGLQLALESRSIRWDPVAWPQLDSEIRTYQVPDQGIVQDSVMALAIGVDGLNTQVRAPRGRVGAPLKWA
jgi:hypothetical protein